MANGIHGRYAHCDRRRSGPPQEVRPPNTGQTGKTRPISQARKECIRPAPHRIPRCRPRRQYDPDGPHKNQGSSRMATTEESDGCPIILRIYGILSLFYPQLFEGSTPPTGPNKESNSLDMDNSSDNGIRNPEEADVLKA